MLVSLLVGSLHKPQVTPLVEAAPQPEVKTPAQVVKPKPKPKKIKKIIKAKVAPVVRVVKGVTNCGDNIYKQYIYQKESGCRTNAINASSGACGIGQALPCSKLPCTLSDWQCQDKWFTNYAISRYGSWKNAYNFWLNNHWW